MVIRRPPHPNKPEWWTIGGSTTACPTIITSTGSCADLPGGETVYFNVKAINGNGINASFEGVFPSTVIPVFTETVFPNIDITIVFNISAGEGKLRIPSQSFNETIEITIKSAISVPNASDTLVKILNTAIEITLDKPIQPEKNIFLTIPYNQSDISGLNENKLIISRYDTLHNEWITLASARDIINNKITAQTNHLSIFQIMQGSPAGDLSKVTAGPNILRPSSNPGQVMTFRNLPANATIKIYTYSGELLYEAAEDGTGNAVWNGKNKSGKQVASGIYIVLIEGAGSKKTLKVAVQR